MNESGVESLLSIISTKSSTYEDPATGERLHNSGNNLDNPDQKHDGAVIIPFPLRNFVE